MKEIRKRSDVKTEETWALEDLYPDEEACRKGGALLGDMLDQFAGYRGTLTESAENLYRALEDYSAMGIVFERVYIYANQHLHEDMGDPSRQKLAQEAEVLRSRYNQETSWLEPEILTIPENQLNCAYEQVPELGKYRIFLERMLREKEHTLSEKEEKVLAKVRELGQAPSNIFAMFNNADLTFPAVENEKGEKLPLTHGRFLSYMQSEDRTLRRNAFQALYGEYARFINTLGAAYDANARQAAFFAGERKFGSALEEALFESAIPVEVYENLIQAVHDHFPAMSRYMELRKRCLGVEELHMYDVYVPIVEDYQAEIPFEEAKEIVKKGLAPLGEDYLSLLEEGFSSRWIDVYENEGKRSGAYSWGAYGVHPYVLLNYQESLDSVFTLAHEMGHALHSWHSDRKQEYLYAGYHTFVAEVASTCNEALLIHDLISRAENPKEKAYLINYFLEQFRTTLFRQTMFAEFEKKTHQIVNEGGTLNGESLSELYGELNRAYYGEQMANDREIRYEWARIPHFYTPFYVYQYATGFSAAIAISGKILAGEPGIVERYKEFLSGGCSKDPIDLLKICGVDMREKKPVEEALKIFERYLDELETLLKKSERG
ncbi:MAG: oligoendopeptidase F [Candidatus Limivivens sp.]|nr:oligoendopeptidase F [Candidatus Limivivens sp.]